MTKQTPMLSETHRIGAMARASELRTEYASLTYDDRGDGALDASIARVERDYDDIRRDWPMLGLPRIDTPCR